MTIMQLRCFVEVARELNYGKAAANLFITQPAVSRHIMSLEADLGTKLLARDRKNVALTAAGTRFYSDAVDILERVDLSRVNLYGNTGKQMLNIGCVSSIQITELSRIFQMYHVQNPETLISNTEITPFDFRRVSARDHLDIAFVPGSADHLDYYSAAALSYQELYKGQLCCVMRNDHPLTQKQEVSFEDLNGETLIFIDHEHCPPEMDDIQLQIRRRCSQMTYYYSGSSLYTVPMIEAGLGIAVMPDFVCPFSDFVVMRPFMLDYELGYGIIYRMHEQEKRIREFIRIAKLVYHV